VAPGPVERAARHPLPAMSMGPARKMGLKIRGAPSRGGDRGVQGEINQFAAELPSTKEGDEVQILKITPSRMLAQATAKNAGLSWPKPIRRRQWQAAWTCISRCKKGMGEGPFLPGNGYGAALGYRPFLHRRAYSSMRAPSIAFTNAGTEIANKRCGAGFRSSGEGLAYSARQRLGLDRTLGYPIPKRGRAHSKVRFPDATRILFALPFMLLGRHRRDPEQSHPGDPGGQGPYDLEPRRDLRKDSRTVSTRSIMASTTWTKGSGRFSRGRGRVFTG